MIESLSPLATALLLAGTATVGLVAYLSHQTAGEDRVLVIDRFGDVDVVFDSTFCVPLVDHVESVDLSLMTLQLDRRGDDSVRCADNIRADMSLTFFVRIDRTDPAVAAVSESVGSHRASDAEAVGPLLLPKFAQALETIAGTMPFEDLYDERVAFREKLLDVIRRDLNGYKLEDIAVDDLEQTDLDHFDPRNPLDRDGLATIVDICADECARSKELRRQERNAAD